MFLQSVCVAGEYDRRRPVVEGEEEKSRWREGDAAGSKEAHAQTSLPGGGGVELIRDTNARSTVLNQDYFWYFTLSKHCSRTQVQSGDSSYRPHRFFTLN